MSLGFFAYNPMASSSAVVPELEPTRGPTTEITSKPPVSDSPATTSESKLRKLIPFKDWGTTPTWVKVASLGGGIAGTYHGYKRNDSVLWALVWGTLGSVFPLITIPIMLAMGFGKKAK